MDLDERDSGASFSPRRAVVVQLFGLFAAFAAVVGGIIAYSASSWSLALFVAFIVFYLCNRFLFEMIFEPQRGRRFVFFGMPPLFAVAGLIGAYQLWETGWLAMLIGFALGPIGWLISASAFPDIWSNEERRTKSLYELLRRGGTSPKGVGETSGRPDPE